MATVALKQICKAFGETHVLRDIDLDVRDGEFVSLLGPSGCGKSTLLRILAGLEIHDTGDIHVGGRDVGDLAPKQRDLAMVFQSYALYPHMTVAQNIGLPLEMRRLKAYQRFPIVGRLAPGARQCRRAIDAEVAAVAESLGLGTLLRRRPNQLSGGQRQRVALARAMVRQPAAFLMDEPLSNLDAKMRVKARTEIVELHRRLKATFIYVTHDQSEAMTMSDRIAVMLDGRILQFDTPQELYNSPNHLSVATFVGTPEINLISADVRSDRMLVVDGATWPVRLSQSGPGKVTLAARPEALIPASVAPPSPGAACSLEGKIGHLEHLGSDTYVHMARGGSDAQVVARLDPMDGVRLAVGQNAVLSVEPRRLLAFDADGRRLSLDVLTIPASGPVRGALQVAHG